MEYKQRVGKFGEKLAKNYLIRHGYQIIDSNVKTSYQEIDIIAKISKKIIFIEVKTRTSILFGTADESINAKKIQNLKKAINNYVEKNDLDLENISLDLISIDINKYRKTAKIRHYKDLF